ncbi:hypothetical protein Xoosp14_229 [Xanthomonas phage Xoo-sp14]|nr:hypothetical protein Xoosp14_229 [Xanthomonas phage Xoo-sp14]
MNGKKNCCDIIEACSDVVRNPTLEGVRQVREMMEEQGIRSEEVLSDQQILDRLKVSPFAERESKPARPAEIEAPPLVPVHSF